MKFVLLLFTVLAAFIVAAACGPSFAEIENEYVIGPALVGSASAHINACVVQEDRAEVGVSAVSGFFPLIGNPLNSVDDRQSRDSRLGVRLKCPCSGERKMA